jgi:hypothetical protein
MLLTKKLGNTDPHYPHIPWYGCEPTTSHALNFQKGTEAQGGHTACPRPQWWS